VLALKKRVLQQSAENGGHAEGACYRSSHKTYFLQTAATSAAKKR